jgi:hypothetical protein
MSEESGVLSKAGPQGMTRCLDLQRERRADGGRLGLRCGGIFGEHGDHAWNEPGRTGVPS